MIRFRVWANQRPMGWFGHRAGEFFFEYDPLWLEQPDAYVLAPQFALQAQPFRGVAVKVFFENLLPEGQALDDIQAACSIYNPAISSCWRSSATTCLACCHCCQRMRQLQRSKTTRA